MLVREISGAAVSYLVSTCPHYSDFKETDDKEEKAKFFDTIYAHKRLIKEFSDESVQDDDIIFFLHDLEGKIEIDIMFSKQPHNRRRYLTLRDVYDEVRNEI